VSEADILFREATAADVPAIFRVRTAVAEKELTIDELAQRGVAPASVAASFAKGSKGWVALHHGEIVAFAIADRASGSIFALFVLPSHERRGIGGRLLHLALRWLAENDIARVWLTTGADTTAAGFYRRRGWESAGIMSNGEIRFACDTARAASRLVQNTPPGVS
jgi:GNAT superfamily N-acetyltransferase